VPEPLRPLSFGQLVDGAARLTWEYPVALVGLALLPSLVVIPLLPFMPDLGSLTGPNGGMPDLEALAPMLPRLVVGALLMALLASILWPVGIAGLTFAAALARIGQAPSFGAAWRIGWKRLWPIGWALTLIALVLVGVMLLVGGGTWAIGGGAVGALLLFAGSVLSAFFMMRMAMILPVVVLEQRFGTAALQRSGALMRGHELRALGLFLVYVAIYLGGVLLSSGFESVPLVGGIAGTLIQLLVQGISGAVTGVVTLLLYLDIRCRTEGFDLERLAQLVAEAGD